MVTDNKELSSATKKKLTTAITASTTTSDLGSNIRKIDTASPDEHIIDKLKKPSAAHAKVLDTVLEGTSPNTDGAPT